MDHIIILTELTAVIDAVVQLVMICALTVVSTDKILIVAGEHPDDASLPLKTSPSSPAGPLASLMNHKLNVNSQNPLFLKNGIAMSPVPSNRSPLPTIPPGTVRRLAPTST